MKLQLQRLTNYLAVSIIISLSFYPASGQTAESILNDYFNLNGGKNELCEHYKNSRSTLQVVMSANNDTLVIVSTEAGNIGGSEETIINLGGTRLRQISTHTQKKGWDIKVTQSEDSAPDTTSVELWTNEKLKEELKCAKSIVHPCCGEVSKLEMIGQDDFEGHKCLKLADKSKNAKGHQEFHFFDAVTKQYYGAKTVDVSANGSLSTLLMIIKEYKTHDNIRVPYIWEMTKDGDSMFFKLAKMESKLRFSEFDFEVKSRN